MEQVQDDFDMQMQAMSSELEALKAAIRWLYDQDLECWRCHDPMEFRIEIEQAIKEGDIRGEIEARTLAKVLVQP